MNWKPNIVVAGRLLAVSIIVLGIVVSAWNGTDISEVSRRGSYAALRGFMEESLDYLWAGALVLVVTEIVGAVGNDPLDLPTRIKWTVPELTAGIAGIVLVVGTVVTLWDIRELNSPGFSDSVRYFLREAVLQYLWQGGMLVALAALADYLSSRSDGALSGEEAGSLVVAEP
jgi:hypothetical protein